jgi:hypothetical protein
MVHYVAYILGMVVKLRRVGVAIEKSSLTSFKLKTMQLISVNKSKVNIVKSLKGVVCLPMVCCICRSIVSQLFYIDTEINPTKPLNCHSWGVRKDLVVTMIMINRSTTMVF